VDSTESCSDLVRDIKLPEHVNDLFCQTVESSNLPLDTIKGLKQLMYDSSTILPVLALFEVI